MRNLSSEEIDTLEKELIKQEEYLLKHSWCKTNEGWISPDKKFHSYDEAYDHLIDRLLIQNGWEKILHVSEITFGLHEGKIFEHVMRQSPFSKKIYNFLEAVSIFEGKLLESDFPKGFNKFTVILNQALPNFSENVFYTQVIKENGKLIRKIKNGKALYEIK